MKASLRRWTFLLALVLLAHQFALAAEQQPLKAGGLEIFYGVIPAEILLGHPDDHAERKMHGGVPSGRGQHHLVVSVFESKSGQRMADAAVTARVTEVGLGGQQKKLEPMPFAGAMTYGNYFRMATRGPYRIQIEVLQPGSTTPVKTSFEYSHPRR